MITRYEEYENSDLDEHGRYKAENSLAFRNDFLDEPLVDQWAYLLEDLLIKRFPDFKKKEKSRFRFAQPLILTMFINLDLNFCVSTCSEWHRNF